MDSLQNIANNRNELLTELARSYAVRPGEFVADVIAPGISKPDLALGAFEAAEVPVAPVADALGQDMVPNFLDTYEKIDLTYFKIQDHELRGRLSNNLRAAWKADGLTDAQCDAKVTQTLVKNLLKNREAQCLNAIITSGNYHSSNIHNAPATKWDNGGTAKADVAKMVDNLDKLGAPTSELYLIASPAIWSALRNNAKVVGTDINGLQPFYSNDDIAKILAGPTAHAVVAKYQVGGNFAMGGNFVIACRPENVAADSLCAWRHVYAGITGSPEPYVYEYSDPGSEHRGKIIGCCLDRKLIAQGADSSGKQLWSAMISSVLT